MTFAHILLASTVLSPTGNSVDSCCCLFTTFVQMQNALWTILLLLDPTCFVIRARLDQAKVEQHKKEEKS